MGQTDSTMILICFRHGPEPARCASFSGVRTGESEVIDPNPLDKDETFISGQATCFTVLDLDSADEQLLKKSIATYGDSPLIARTGSGHFHIWYRWNGEQSHI